MVRACLDRSCARRRLHHAQPGVPHGAHVVRPGAAGAGQVGLRGVHHARHAGRCRPERHTKPSASPCGALYAPSPQVSHTVVRSVSLQQHDGEPPEKYVRYLARHEYTYVPPEHGCTHPLHFFLDRKTSGHHIDLVPAHYRARVSSFQNESNTGKVRIGGFPLL
ncbi:jg13031 [Pararge aegeria aegeria]|uniref:Jg13031 protein n=1 Tax=Pararge aegeria aegeria TaxID=348720 RepID=A0A8S4QJ39_9NEOP|nr:jg13031 [Pararge aegeria aegeria]